ncbi:MAG: hypothetical protein KF819_22320 [Labilithrix sp.]|nr:hypothetical protein [Labilithrix sp.]
MRRLAAVATLAALFFAVAGVTLAGCSDDYRTGEVPAQDAAREARPTPAEDAEPSACPSTTPVDASKLPWKAATPPQSDKCQLDHITRMKEFLAAEPNATNEEFQTFVKNLDTACHDCVFSPAEGATWPPIPVSGGKVVTLNIGACYALVSGKDDCGKAVQNTFDCEFEACAECTSTGELESCRAKSRSGACKAFAENVRLACAGVPPTVDDACGSVFDSVRVQCVSSVTDAGDAGDAGDM